MRNSAPEQPIESNHVRINPRRRNARMKTGGCLDSHIARSKAFNGGCLVLQAPIPNPQLLTAHACLAVAVYPEREPTSKGVQLCTRIPLSFAMVMRFQES